MAGNKPLTREEFREYRKERDRIYKAVETAKRTVKVMYKSLCPTCEYNATHGKPIVTTAPIAASGIGIIAAPGRYAAGRS